MLLLGCFFVKFKKYIGCITAGLLAGCINGLFGAGGGMVLVPALTLLTDMEDSEIFPASVSIILPICLISMAITWRAGAPDWKNVLPYLLGSALGGIAAGIWGRKLPTIWLHRILGVLILWGGVRYLC